MVLSLACSPAAINLEGWLPATGLRRLHLDLENTRLVGEAQLAAALATVHGTLRVLLRWVLTLPTALNVAPGLRELV